MEVEAFIENKDIGFVRPGQAAEIKLETFPFTRYGTLPASVASVSHDAQSDESRGLIYSTRIQLQRTKLDIGGQTVPLTPCMAASVEIKTGTRTLIEYFLSPLLQHTQESLRER